jgi:hypothetical protein
VAGAFGASIISIASQYLMTPSPSWSMISRKRSSRSSETSITFRSSAPLFF